MDKMGLGPPPVYSQQQQQHQAPPAGFINPGHHGFGGAGPTANVVKITTTVPLGKHPVAVECPHCRRQVVTKIDSKPGLLAWVAGGLLCLFGCVCGCCLIPCFVFKDVDHSCPQCGAHLGQHRF